MTISIAVAALRAAKRQGAGVQLTPSQAFEHIKESAVSYLETAYKIACPEVFAERAAILRERGVVAQSPFIEATPAFPPGRMLADLQQAYPELLPGRLAELVAHGVPVDRFPLYQHQEEALLASMGERPNLLVATGTGSGKTEAFVLPILADILREARNWSPVSGPPLPGRYDAATKSWLHGRRHETRPAGLRAIVLYPMNALVNDQLSRLRRILSRGDSPDWQRSALGGNVIHFGMYTSLTRPTGSPDTRAKRNGFEQHAARLAEDWAKLRKDLRDTGGWPRPDSTEMLCRWDMQAAPPDILVTNYSMLEYMLVRPLEHPIFARTRKWLESDPTARLTLVLDEAHTYTGAKGTEVAHLVRRLKERLGITSGSQAFRGIATSASIPNKAGADKELLAFTSDLFGEPAPRFTLVRVPIAKPPDIRTPTPQALAAYAQFHDHFTAQNPLPAIVDLAADLDITLPNEQAQIDPQVLLHRLLAQNPDVLWLRTRTARNATLLDVLARECWGSIGTLEEQERATAGILAAGSFARPEPSTDIPPLLSVRMHAFFRGIPGLWACLDPECPEVAGPYRLDGKPRPFGKLYTDPRPWCSARCGARVLEVFSCRHCGLLFLGGIPDAQQHSLWPWSDDLSGERADLRSFRIFGVEQPHSSLSPTYRSTRTTLVTHPAEPLARPAYETDPAKEGEREVSPYPSQCPRCHKYRAPGSTGREVIEPLRTKGPRAFSIVMEDGFRVQPRAVSGVAPNYGRKALIFADSRQEAAKLAADLRYDHGNDLIRQLLYRALHLCDACGGRGEVVTEGPYIIGQEEQEDRATCGDCAGTGYLTRPKPLAFTDLRARVIALELERGIDPTIGEMHAFFASLAAGKAACYDNAELAFDVALRRELSEDQFSLEPFGLASWRVRLPDETGTFEPLSESETKVLLRTVARILASEDVLLPAKPREPWGWPKGLVPEYQRRVMLPGGKAVNQIVPYNLQPYRKLGRYIIAVSQALAAQGRLEGRNAASWVGSLHWPLWQALRGFDILQIAGAKVNAEFPRGIRIDSFELHPVEGEVWRCGACAYVMSEAVLGVCARCGQQAILTDPETVSNYYRRAALHALPESDFDDPYPLRSVEHTAQIAGHEARDIERWFQELFHDDQNPLDDRIDVLSVTTTMEMGIDIGSLLCVGLRNVPPTVANYQQRAGRAGRRGSALATVLTFALGRSHDQYYFGRPPEIVSDPPRVPALYMGNEVIARRHVRSLVPQDFFYRLLRQQPVAGLFGSWGTVGDYIQHRTAERLRSYLNVYRDVLPLRCSAIVHPMFQDRIVEWIEAIPSDVQDVVERRSQDDDLLGALIDAGQLPGYAFPVDLVGLSIPTLSEHLYSAESSFQDSMQRDLAIALTEYAPGAEVVKGSFPNTYIYQSAGVYDPYEKRPDYGPTGLVIECSDCKATALTPVGAEHIEDCPECGGPNVTELPYLRPRGFTVDAALPSSGAELFKGGDRERAGFTAPARLLVGQTAFTAGTAHPTFAPRLHTQVRVGELFSANRGSNPDFPGFLICPTCGRAIEEGQEGRHSYPASVPPHRGRNRGPRAGTPCPTRSELAKQVVLGHRFYSEILLLGVDLPPEMDAPFLEPVGKAVWYSFGTLIANAAALVLQIDRDELQVGVRPVRRPDGRIHGEVFLYDNVSGGAGYARAIERNLEEILHKAADLGRECANPNCGGACYHCLFDYRNQSLHPLLDRGLATAVLDYLLLGTLPQLGNGRADRAAEALAEFARAGRTVSPARMVGKHYFAALFESSGGDCIGLWVLHPLLARPEAAVRQALLEKHGIRCAVHTAFDLERRPFWVLNHLVR